MDLSASKNNRIDSDGVKLIWATAAKEICDNAIQVLGGYGYVGEYVVERLWRDAKLIEIGGGTIEAHQKNLAKDLSKNLDLLKKIYTAKRLSPVDEELRSNGHNLPARETQFNSEAV